MRCHTYFTYTGPWPLAGHKTKQLSRTDRTSFIPPGPQGGLAFPNCGQCVIHHRRLLLGLNCSRVSSEITIEVILCKYSRQSKQAPLLKSYSPSVCTGPWRRNVEGDKNKRGCNFCSRVNKASLPLSIVTQEGSAALSRVQY